MTTYLKYLLFFSIFMLSGTLFAENSGYVMASTSREVNAYNLDGQRIVRYEPTVGRITRTDYNKDGRIVREALEYRAMPALPWFFSSTGAFFAFMPNGSLRYYSSVDTYVEYEVHFTATSILQVLDDNTLLIRNNNNNLALWHRSLNQVQNLQVHLYDMAKAIYVKMPKGSDMLVLAKEERLDYYTNPALGSVASQYEQSIALLSRDTWKPLLENWIGSDPVYDGIEERIYFFHDKKLSFMSLKDKKIYHTKFLFDYILTAVSGNWQAPSVLYLGEDRYLIWHRIPFEKSQQAQLSLYDGASGVELDNWQFMGEQGSLALVKEVI